MFVLEVDAPLAVSCLGRMQLQPQGLAAKGPQQAAVLSEQIHKQQRLTQVQPLDRRRPTKTVRLHCGLLICHVCIPPGSWAEGHNTAVSTHGPRVWSHEDQHNTYLNKTWNPLSAQEFELLVLKTPNKWMCAENLFYVKRYLRSSVNNFK